MRLIDADELAELYVGWLPQLVVLGYEGDKRGVENCIDVLLDATTIDAVPVEQVKAQVIDIVKSFEVLVGCTGVGVITKAIERMETPSPYITL